MVHLSAGRGHPLHRGKSIRAIRHKWRPILTVPARSFARHSVIIGSSGSGKTNLMMRLWAGWYAATHATYLRGEGHRPLLVVLDCKGGPDARVKAERTRRLLHGVGARRVAIWPDEARLCLWDLPPRDLGVLLLAMIETGNGAAAYYTDIMQAVVNLALAAPGGPPANAASFLDRLDVEWLETAYGDGLHGAAVSRIRAAKPHVGDIQLRYATLLGRLGPALDGPGDLAGADAWYCNPGRHRPHVAGNSLGGVLALGLAAYGRAANATALSPAGFWRHDSEFRWAKAIFKIMEVAGAGDHPAASVLSRSRAGRAVMYAAIVSRPSRVSPAQAHDDAIAFGAARDAINMIISVPASFTLPIPDDVPVTIAWGRTTGCCRPGRPPSPGSGCPRRGSSGCPGCGHVPMTDDPALVAQVLLDGSARTVVSDRNPSQPNGG